MSESSAEQRRTSDETESVATAIIKPGDDSTDLDYSDVFDSLTVSLADVPFANGSGVGGADAGGMSGGIAITTGFRVYPAKRKGACSDCTNRLHHH